MSGAKEYPAEPVACEILRGEGFVFALCFRMQRGPPPVVLATIHLSRGRHPTYLCRVQYILVSRLCVLPGRHANDTVGSPAAFRRQVHILAMGGLRLLGVASPTFKGKYPTHRPPCNRKLITKSQCLEVCHIFSHIVWHIRKAEAESFLTVLILLKS